MDSKAQKMGLIDEDRFRILLAQRRRRQLLVIGVPGIILTTLFFLFTDVHSRSTLSIVGIALSVALVLFTLWNWRCPRCEAFLGREWSGFCPQCGHNL